jgi:TRAP transporter TAXI family solute receptor
VARLATQDERVRSARAGLATLLLLGASVGLAAPGPLPSAAGAAAWTIVTGDERETDFAAGEDLARLVAAPVGLAWRVLPSKGAADNVHRLAADPAVDLAIVQYDVLRAFFAAARSGNGRAATLVAPIGVVAPLYTQEITFIVRRDSPLRTVDDIRGRTIAVGPLGSGSALTASAVYREMFGVQLRPDRVRYLDERDALAALAIDRSVDVVVLVAGQPARALTELKPEAKQFIRLLPVDPASRATRAAYRSYFPSTIRATSYPAWLGSDVPTLSVMSFLVTRTDRGASFDASLDAFSASLCRSVDALRDHGHPKWREVDVTMKLGAGWTYVPAAQKELARCPLPPTTARRD